MGEESPRIERYCSPPGPDYEASALTDSQLESLLQRVVKRQTLSTLPTCWHLPEHDTTLHSEGGREQAP